VSPVPRLRRYYEGATTSRSRTPDPLFASVTGPTRSSNVRVRLSAPDEREVARQTWVVGKPASHCRHAAPWARAGYHRFPGDPSYAFALLQDPGRSGRTSPLAALPTPPPVGPDRRHPRARYIEAKHRASASAVYASRATSPPLVQDSLPAGGLRLCREGVEPSGSLRKVSGHILPPFQDFVLSQGP
jgi:hypothetical protein